MSDPILSIRNLGKRFGGLVVTDGVSLDVHAGEVHALIGPNGAGKTTLIGQITGTLTPDSGEILCDGQSLLRMSPHQRVRLGLARSFQVSSVLSQFTVLDNARLAVLGHRLPRLGFWRPVSSDADAEAAAMAALARVGLEDRAHVTVGNLSYGERRHLELAMALALQPRVMLLDEPMAGVGTEESRRLTALLRDLSRDCAILLVEHDMDVVFSLADRISVLVAGRIIASGPAEALRDNEEVKLAYFGEEDVW